jgi:predicted DNA-binding transcriptional regulator AlpA
MQTKARLHHYLDLLADSPSDSPQSTSTLPELLTTPELLTHLGISRPTLCSWQRFGGFPRPFRLSARRFGWKVSEVEQWLQSRPRG